MEPPVLTESKRPFWKRWFFWWVIVAFLVILGACGPTNKAPDPEQSGSNISLTRAEWMQRAAQSSMSPQSLTASNVLLANQARLYQAVGSPTSTESSGFKDLLIWQCSDGTITVEAESSGLSQGVISGDVRSE
jgi:hypothetical protein